MKETRIILYTPLTIPAGRRLLAAVEAVVENDRLEVFEDRTSLTRRLRQPIYNDLICILFAETRKALSSFVNLRVFLRNIRLILLLPDDGPDTIAQAHTFYPRFLSYGYSDFSDVAAVVAKMTGAAGGRRTSRMGKKRGTTFLEKGREPDGGINPNN